MIETYSESFPLRQEVRAKVNEAVLNAVAKEEGYEVVEIKYTFEYSHPTLCVFVWKKNGIEIDDLENVHNAVSVCLDAFDEEFPSEYTLNVSSSGLDREIKSDDDLRRALDTEIEVTLKSENGTKEKTHGKLLAYDADAITIQTTGKTPKNKQIFRNTTTKVQPYIRF